MLESIEEQTGVTPKALLDAPKLHGVAKEVSTLYNILASRRTAGFSANPIQLSEIYALISLYGAPTLPIDIFIELIGTMDIKFLELSNGDKSTS